MPITKQFGPSASAYGQAVYGSAQNQERYKRTREAAQDAVQNRATQADTEYKKGMLELEQDKWAKQWPLLEKESDLKEIETWLDKSVAYLEARLNVAQQRIAEKGQILQASQVEQQGYSVPSRVKVGPSASGGIGVGIQQGRQVPGMSYSAALGSIGQADRGARGTGQSSDMRQMAANAQAQLAEIESRYQTQLAEIDKTFGVADGWTPKLFMPATTDQEQAS